MSTEKHKSRVGESVFFLAGENFVEFYFKLFTPGYALVSGLVPIPVVLAEIVFPAIS
jgi:hypothetical protein